MIVILFGDLECDGFRDQATTMHCGVWKEFDKDKFHIFRANQIKEMTEFLDGCESIIMHNGISYDLPVLKRLVGWEPKVRLIDTLVMSHTLYPTLKQPKGAKGYVMPHSIEAWAIRFGEEQKIDIQDWSVWTQEMEDRCKVDVLTCSRLFKFMVKREGMTRRMVGL